MRCNFSRDSFSNVQSGLSLFANHIFGSGIALPVQFYIGQKANEQNAAVHHGLLESCINQ